MTAPYGNRCVGLAEINAVLRDVTHLYIDHGYVTSRAYVPQQDIRKTRILRLLVVEGTLSDIYLNGRKVVDSGSLATAFPGLIGRVVNIRDIEQGLDQMNRLQAKDAKSAMLPGPKDGTSILNIENRPAGPGMSPSATTIWGRKAPVTPGVRHRSPSTTCSISTTGGTFHTSIAVRTIPGAMTGGDMATAIPAASASLRLLHRFAERFLVPI